MKKFFFLALGLTLASAYSQSVFARTICQSGSITLCCYAGCSSTGIGCSTNGREDPSGLGNFQKGNDQPCSAKPDKVILPSGQGSGSKTIIKKPLEIKK